MRVDESVAYYWTSLGLSAAAVFLFLWLVRAPRRRAAAERKAPPISPSGDAPAPQDPQKASRADT